MVTLSSLRPGSSHFVSGVGPRLRHKYPGGNTPIRRRDRAALAHHGDAGQIIEAVQVLHAARKPRSPTGRTSSRPSEKMRNISAVQRPIPFTATK